MGRSIWTKIFGALAAIPQVIPDFGHYHGMPINGFLSAIGIFLLGLVTKQANVTGGSVPQPSTVNVIGK